MFRSVGADISESPCQRLYTVFFCFLYFLVCRFSLVDFPFSLLLILCSEPPGVNKDAHSLDVSLNDMCILQQLSATNMFAVG